VALPSISRKDVIFLLFHLLTTLAKLTRPGGSRTIVAENQLLKPQLIIRNLTTTRRTRRTRRQANHDNSLRIITPVECVRSDEYIQSFYPPATTPFRTGFRK
jgi:hypothetical protein